MRRSSVLALTCLVSWSLGCGDAGDDRAIPDGSIRFEPAPRFHRAAPAGGTVVGSGAIVKFPLRITTSVDETFVLSPTIAGLPGWSGHVVDAEGARRPDTLAVPRDERGAAFEVFVLIEGAGDAGHGEVGLTVSSERNGALERSARIAFDLGAAAPPPPVVGVTLRAANPPARPDGGVVIFPRRASPPSAILELDVRPPLVLAGGERYRVRAAVVGRGWTVTTIVPESPPYAEGPAALFRPALRVTADAPDAPPATLRVMVESIENGAHAGELLQDIALD